MRLADESSGFLTQQAKLSCLYYRLHPIRYTQFGEDVADMAFDGINSNHQFLRDLLVGCAVRQQLENLEFSFAQGLGQRLGLYSLLYLGPCHAPPLKGCK